MKVDRRTLLKRTGQAIGGAAFMPGIPQQENRQVQMNPGDEIESIDYEGIHQRIVILSSDKEPGWEASEPIWRCASFKRLRANGRCLGAQIVLYTESELKQLSNRATNNDERI